ncbi:odorant receptor 85f isoform X2 [Monomorium pharaonis]|uniref:odorant receptor 85f isoform X2 n=1 Tax=Monomorium pharaonis TaxID=307658 RepID=UPI00063FA5FC|nr:odorant receptor 85f isoform X2 [Monomorium pharaonis]
MMKNLTLKKVIAVTKISLFATWCWPLPKNTVKLKVICVRLYQYLCLILTLSLTAGLMNTVKNHVDEPLIMAKSIIVMSPTVHVICNIICCKIYSRRLQLVTFEMENFSELLKPREEEIVQRYIDKCVYFYGGSILCIYLSAIVIITGPVTLDQPFPSNAEYPFVMYKQPLKSIIFVHQSFVFIQAAGQICMNVFIALLLWTTSARFELLTIELRAVTDIHGLIKCIREHKKLLQYAKEVVTIARPFALSTISLSTFALIIIGLILVTNQPLSIKIQCVGLTFSGLSEVFMYTWPAEHLMHISGEIRQAVFDTQWYKQSIALRKYLQIIMLKAQNPIVIAIPCVMPALSLNYYASYLSTIFSYFTTLRIIMQNGQSEE